MNKDEDYICFYRDAVVAGHDASCAETMRRFNLTRHYTVPAAERGHRTMRWSGYPQLESTNEVARAASAIEDPSGLGRLNPSCRATA